MKRCVQDFERCLAQARLETVVVGEFRKRERLLPTLAEGDHTGSEHVFKYLVHSFNLAITLRVKSGGKVNTSSHSLLKASPELRGEQASTIRDDLPWNTLENENPRDIQVS